MTDQPVRIFIPQPIRPEGLRLLQEVGQVEMVDTDGMLNRDELLAGLTRSDFVLCIGNYAIDGDALQANRHLKGIACAAHEVSSLIDLARATSLRIPVSGLSTDVYGTVCRSTAELTMALLISLAWRVSAADAYMRSGRFRQEQSVHFTCTSLSGKTLGLVGLGQVARLVVPRARSFELDVIYTKRDRLDPMEEDRLGVTWVPTVDQLLQTSDCVSIHANHNDSSHRLIGKRELQLMKPSAFLVNTARGRILDETALIEALRSGVIAGAGLDVYWGEPPLTTAPSPNPELFTLSNVVLTPHVGGQSEVALSSLARCSAENLVAMVRGERPPDLINPEVYS